MSTSEPKKKAATASEPAGSPDPRTAAREPDESGGSHSPADSKTDAKLGTLGDGQPVAAVESRSGDAADQAASRAAETASGDEPVWPPPESKPESKLEDAKLDDAKLDDAKPEDAKVGDVKLDEAAAAAKPDEPDVLTKPAEPLPAVNPEESSPVAIAKAGEPASEPHQEMGLSESTLHWLVDSEQPIEVSERNPILVPAYDLHAPVAGRKRAVAIIGGAAILALGIAWALHAQAARHQIAAVAPTLETAGLLTRRAEEALEHGRRAEAMDLAHLAIVTDPGAADAYVIVGAIQRSNGQMNEARDSYRRYLELAPLGTRAAEAREALTSLPP
jgi:hypothetical protein